MSDDRYVTAFAPASIGNVGVGYDMLGLAISGAGDRVSVRKVDRPGVHIKQVLDIDGEVHPLLNNDPATNTASISAAALWSRLGDRSGLELVIHKGIPLQSGMGSSAASAVAGAVAANAMLRAPLEMSALLPFALQGEEYASGGVHADNVAPSLLGGLILCPPALLPELVSLTVPTGVSSVLVHPELQVNTAESRSGLARHYSMEQWLEQQGYLGAFIAACSNNDHRLLARCLHDVIIEPQRAAAVPCFPAVKEAAVRAGAFGCSLSGSGPSIFALCVDTKAPRIATAMEQACRTAGIACQSWISPMDAAGARVESA